MSKVIAGSMGRAGGGTVARFVTVHRKLSDLNLLHIQPDRKLNAVVNWTNHSLTPTAVKLYQNVTIKYSSFKTHPKISREISFGAIDPGVSGPPNPESGHQLGLGK